MAIEPTEIIFQYKLDKLVEVFENDNDLKALLKKEELYLDYIDGDGYTYNAEVIYPPRVIQYENILNILINNSEVIADTIITNLLLVNDIRDLLNVAFYQRVAPITDEIYRQILFTFKYSTVKSFFKENYANFMPSYDVTVINDSEKMKLLQEAFMQEFDKFAEIISNITDINDIDTVAEEYLDYIAQLVGFERGDTNLGNALFREITKNIIEVYRIKGTNYSFELFFNFIGFEIEVIEYWFDKRFYFSTNLQNPYTKETSKYKFAYYLTPNKPTDVIPLSLPNPFTVMENELVKIRNGLIFDHDLAINSDDLEKYLDISGTPDVDMNYTYFKTNVVEYSITKITSDEIPEGLTQKDEETIQSYVNFLTPIFASKKIVINIIPFKDNASITLLIKDDNIGSTSMFSIFRDPDFIELLLKVAFDYTDHEEKELWNLDLTDKLFQELNFLDVEWNDLKNLQEIPLYNNLDEKLDGFSISYPYIENKDISTDFTLESSADNLMVDPKFYNDIMVMSSKSTSYTGSGDIEISGNAEYHLFNT